MTDGNNFHGQYIILNVVDDPVVSFTNSVS